VSHLYLATGPDTHRNISIGLFVLFVAVTLYITLWASRHNKTAADY
jgi:cation/acetate symporter